MTTHSVGVRRRGRRRATVRRGSLAVAVGMAVMAMGLTSCQPPNTLTVTDHVTGITRPWDLAFTPDGTMLYTLKGGTINGFIGGVKTTFTGQPADAVSIGEGGMMGLAVDPDFSSNRRVYACYMSNLGSFGGYDIRVGRWTLDAGYAALTFETWIVTGIPVNTAGQTGRHSGCRPRFSPDGRLFIGTGDAATAANPQSKTSLGGKVLRVDTNGNGVAGNPGVDTPASGFDPRIYTYGHRNVQGIAFRPTDGQAFSVEHGSYRDDELNKLVAGGNYGWDPLPPYNESPPMTDLVKYPSAIPAVWSSGNPTIAPSGFTFLSGDQWSGWNNNPVMAVLKNTHLRGIILDGADGIYREDLRVTDQGRLRSAVQGPDGNLYIATDTSPFKIIKVVPS